MWSVNIFPVTLKSVSEFVSTKIGVASDNLTISGYDTQYGEGINTSSPLFKTAWHKLYILCLHPVETKIWFKLYFSRWGNRLHG